MTATTSSPSNRREWLVVAILTAIAAVARFWRFGTLGLTHFDEGIYASSGAWAFGPAGLASLDPEVIAYAPPGYPVLVGLGYLVFGLSDVVPILIAIVCGIATVPVAGWVARRTFGPGAGAAGAAFAALAAVHIAFSRKALTDAPFLLAWLIALGLGGRFLERPGALRAVVFGLAVGLAQNLKYNGYLAGLIVVAAACVALGVDPAARQRRAVVRTFGWGLVAAGIAASTYVPWYLFVASHGGYADLLRHQRSYLGGAATWLPHWRQQLAQVVALSGGVRWSAATWVVAWIAATVACGVRKTPTESRWDWPRYRIGLIGGAAALATFLDASWWLGAAWCGWLVVDRRPAARLLAVWWLVLSVLTPFYHPYARLWLPLHAAGWILLAGAVVCSGPFGVVPTIDPRQFRDLFARPRVAARVLVFLLCAVVAHTHWPGSEPAALAVADIFAPTNSVRNEVAALTNPRILPLGQGVSIRVLARRPVAFYAALRGCPVRLASEPEAILAGPDSLQEWALVDAALMPREDLLRIRTNQHGLLFTTHTRRPTRYDPVTLLDNLPQAAYDSEVDPTSWLTLMEPLLIPPSQRRR